MTPDYEMEYLDIRCPEGYGEARIIFKVLIHKSSRKGVGVIDKKTALKPECHLRDELLKQGKQCREECKGTDEYKSFLRSINVG